MKCLSSTMTLLTALAMLVPATASAFYVESRSEDMAGDPVPVAYDTSTPVEFRIASAGMPGGDGSEFEAVAAAFATWAAVDCVTIDFTEGPRNDAPAPRHWTAWEGIDDPAFERYISVYWSDDAGQFPTATVGFFDRATDGTTSQLIGGTIILNSRHHSWSTTGEAGLLDVQSVVTALLGRSLGITSAMEGNATYPSYSPGDTSKRTLGDDDIAAISYIYGDDTCTVMEVPEGICTGAPLEDCPPTPDVDAGTGTRDGGTSDGGSGTPDGGTGTPDGSTGGDAGADGGGGDDGGGCSVGDLRSENTPGWIALLLLVGLGITGRRRR